MPDVQYPVTKREVITQQLARSALLACLLARSATPIRAQVAFNEKPIYQEICHSEKNIYESLAVFKHFWWRVFQHYEWRFSLEYAVSARRLASSKELIDESSQIWIDHKLEMMEFCVRTKLVWNWVRFGNLLRSTEDKTIYMVSTTDKFWGVKECDDGLVGENQYGKLLMRIRDELVSDDNEALRIVIPPPELDLVFLGQSVQTRDRRDHLRQVGTRTTDMVNALRP